MAFKIDLLAFSLFLVFFVCISNRSGGGGGTRYNGLCGEASGIRKGRDFIS